MFLHKGFEVIQQRIKVQQAISQWDVALEIIE